MAARPSQPSRPRPTDPAASSRSAGGPVATPPSPAAAGPTTTPPVDAPGSEASTASTPSVTDAGSSDADATAAAAEQAPLNRAERRGKKRHADDNRGAAPHAGPAQSGAQGRRINPVRRSG